jgi:uncharacterized membrane protein
MNPKSSAQIVLTAVFAALYSVGVAILAPISFQVFQVRIADALLPLAMLFGWPAVLGISLGAFVANVFGGLGPVDMIGGALANFIATFAAWRIATRGGKRWTLFGVAVEILVVTLIVGSYLSFLLGIPLQVSWLGIMLGSSVAIGLLGSILLFALTRRGVTAVLEAHGLRDNRDVPRRNKLTQQ